MTSETPHPTKRKRRILIVDDHPLVREGLAVRISSQPDLEVCGEAADEQEALNLAAETKPDLVIVDISLKSGHGIDLMKRLRAHDGRIKMLVCSMHEESLYAERALRAGAGGYVNKQESREKVIEAIRQVLEGRRYLSRQMTERLVGRAIDAGSTEASSPLDALSDRELEVFQLIGQGLTTGEIANRLHLSVHTIDSHREKIKAKLNLKSGSKLSRAAIQWALEHG